MWIPRYKYKITDTPGVAEPNSAGTVDVKFISVEEKSGATVNGVTYTTYKNGDGEFITQDEQNYIIHPAFEDGSKNGAKAQRQSNYVEYNNGEWDSELAGFWVAKYEMSMEDGNGNEVVLSSETEWSTIGNVEISDTVKMVSKPNRSSWRYITTGTLYKNCYKYNRENSSHMIKMSEWGAIAFLTLSQYGRNGNNVMEANETNYITGYAGEEESTTGNIYGVHDLNGGAWEQVAAWDRLATSSSLTSNGNVIIDGYEFGVSGGVSSKYATAYENGTETEMGVLAKKICKVGDAIKELSIIDGYNGGWFAGTNGFGKVDKPFFRRGATLESDSNKGFGLLTSLSASGTNYYYGAGRAILIL